MNPLVDVATSHCVGPTCTQDLLSRAGCSPSFLRLPHRSLPLPTPPAARACSALGLGLFTRGGDAPMRKSGLAGALLGE